VRSVICFGENTPQSFSNSRSAEFSVSLSSGSLLKDEQEKSVNHKYCQSMSDIPRTTGIF